MLMLPKDSNPAFGEENDMPADIHEKAPGVYVRDEQELPRELDLLWSNPRAYHRDERSPVISFILGLVLGIALTSAVFLLLVMRPSIQAGTNAITAPLFEHTDRPGAATPKEARSGATPVGGTTYKVVSGDTLGRISQKVYGTIDPKYLQKIQRANKMSNPNSLQLNQTLVIPPKEY